MIKIKENQLSLNDVLYDAGDLYSSHHEVKKVIVKSLELNGGTISINNYYRLYYIENEGYFSSFDNLYFSEKKATNVVDNYILQEQQRKRKYEKEEEKKEKNKKRIIDEKLEAKYINVPIMIYRENEWVKTKVKEIFATDVDIYLVPYIDGHLCKLSREGKTWKMWSELEELEEQKRKLEERIEILRGEE